MEKARLWRKLVTEHNAVKLREKKQRRDVNRDRRDVNRDRYRDGKVNKIMKIFNRKVGTCH